MTPPPQTPPANPPVAFGNTTGGLALRIGFFVFTVYISIHFVFPVLHLLFGRQVSNTLGLAITGLLANVLTLAIFDRRPLVDLGLRLVSASGIHFLWGLALGGGAAAVLLTAPLLVNEGHLLLRANSDFLWSKLIFYLITLFFAAVGEELIFHGYAFQSLVEKIGPYAAVIPVGVIFGLMHSDNPHATLFGVINTVLWGVLLGCAFLRSRDLWLPIGIHFGWNSVLPLFGVNLSGITMEVTRYFYKWDLPALWSGGDYGPEGGVLTTIFGVIVFYLIYRAPLRPQQAAIATRLNEPDEVVL